MRELSMAELDMVIGGYSQGDLSVYESSATDNGDGSYGLVVTQEQYNADVGYASAQGWDVEVGGTINNGGWSVSLKVKKSC